MLKQIKIQGQSFELYSADEGRTWSSSAASLVAFERRKKTARSKLQETKTALYPFRGMMGS